MSLLKVFLHTRLQTQIVVLSMIVVLSVVGVFGAGSILNQRAIEKNRATQSLMAMASIIGSNSTAALVFHDHKTLTENLSSLRQRRNVIVGCVYDQESRLIATYQRAQKLHGCPPEPDSTEHEFTKDLHLIVRTGILLERKRIGTLVLESDLHEMHTAIRTHWWVLSALSLCALTIAYFLSRELERLISTPILHLSAAARQVTRNNDYSIRIPRQGGLEIGILVDALNQMLARTEADRVEREHLLDEARTAISLRDDFLAIASHELRTPLTPLKAELQLIQRLSDRDTLRTTPPEHLKKLITDTDRQVVKLSRLIDDLLDVTRIMSGKFVLKYEPINLADTIRDVLTQFKQDIVASGSEVRVDLDNSASGVWDGLRIEQIVTNLVSNALKYGNGNPISLSARKLADRVIFTVEDSGIGISADDQKRIFQRFERAVSSSHYGGLGLGLYITRKICEALRGRIQVVSASNRGATFTVELPLNSATEQLTAT